MKNRYLAAFGLLTVMAATVGQAQPVDASTPPSDASQNASAETTAPPSDTPQSAPPSKKKWEFAPIVYVWFAGAGGETDVIGPVAPIGLDLPFGTVLKGFKFAFMGAAEARHDRIVVLGDLNFIHLGTKKGIDIRDRDFLDANLHSRTAEITLVGGY